MIWVKLTLRRRRNLTQGNILRLNLVGVTQAKMIRYVITNHDYNKILKSDWLSTALISALIGQFNRTVRVMPDEFC